MIELDLQCANKHQKPIVSVILDDKIVKNQKLLCHECLETYTQEARIMGFTKINQMIEDSQKQKREFLETLIDNNQKLLKSIQLSLVGLKSTIIQELDSIYEIIKSWIKNMNIFKSDTAAFSFFEELDKIISYGQQKVIAINKETILNEIKKINNSWSVKCNNKLNNFNQFEDCLKCQVILKDFIIQEQAKPISSHVIKQNPPEISNNEFQNIFSIFKRELSETQQFKVLEDNEQNQVYLESFHQNILEKIKNQNDQLLDIKQFFSFEIKYDVVAKADIQNYLNNQFRDDCRNLYDDDFENFISILDYLEINYDKQKKKLLKSKFKTANVSDFQNSLKYKVNNKEIDFSCTNFGQTFQNVYKSLKVIQRIDQSWDNNLQFKKSLQQQYIIINTKIEIEPRQNDYKQSFSYIKSPKDNDPTYFIQNFPQQFNTIIFDQNGWIKLYQELYDLIKLQIGNSKQKIEQLGYQSNQNTQFLNNFIITDIIQKVQNNIKVKYNKQFALFGVILSDVGERCIYYYSMLIIWIFCCRNSELKNQMVITLRKLLN